MTAILMMAGCSSSPEVADSMPNPDTDIVQDRLDISQELNANYCEMEGFKRFYESERYYNFVCMNDSKFRVPK